MGLQQGRIHRLNTPGAWELALIRSYVVGGQLIQIKSGPSGWKCGLPNRANAHEIVLIKACATYNAKPASRKAGSPGQRSIRIHTHHSTTTGTIARASTARP